MSAAAYKAQATRLAVYLKESLSIPVTRATALELTAAVYGARDWNTLAAAQVRVSNATRSAMVMRKLQGLPKHVQDAVRSLTGLGVNEGVVFQALHNQVPGVYVLESRDSAWLAAVKAALFVIAEAVDRSSSGQTFEEAVVFHEPAQLTFFGEFIRSQTLASQQLWMFIDWSRHTGQGTAMMTWFRENDIHPALSIQGLTIESGIAKAPQLRLTQTFSNGNLEPLTQTFSGAILAHLKAGRMTVPAAANALRYLFKADWS